MIYFFDNNFSPKHARMLAALGVEVRVLRDEFPENVKDVDYLPRLRDTGWILITSDKHIRVYAE